MRYDYLIVGAGLYGATFAQQMTEAGRRCLVVERRGHIGGNAYTELVNGVTVHRYGPHIFHTNDRQIWSYVRRFDDFNRFTNSPMAYYRGRMYSLPFNMLTFSQMPGHIRWVNKKKLRATYTRGELTPSDVDMALQELMYNRIILQPKYLCVKAFMDKNDGAKNDRRAFLEFTEAMRNKWGKYYAYNKKRNIGAIRVKR